MQVSSSSPEFHKVNDKQARPVQGAAQNPIQASDAPAELQKQSGPAHHPADRMNGFGPPQGSAGPSLPLFPGVGEPYQRPPFFDGPSFELRDRGYREACNSFDGYRLLDLARLESEHQLMPDLKAGNILMDAYSSALRSQDARLLVEIAQLEAEKNLMPDIKAGNILRDAYQIAHKRQDAGAMFEVANLENEAQLLPDLKAGNIARDAYQLALKRRDAYTLMDMASHPKLKSMLPDISADTMMRDAYQMPRYGGHHRPY